MEALALLELDSIAVGIETTDAVMKVARVELLESRPIDPGKYMILFRGDVGSVDSSYQRGREVGGGHLVDQVFLPQAHSSIIPILAGELPGDAIDALGIIETSAVASIILAADAAAKAASTTLLRIHLARRIGGKGYIILTGIQADVEASVQAGAEKARGEGTLVAEVVIPAPAGEIFDRVTRNWLES